MPYHEFTTDDYVDHILALEAERIAVLGILRNPHLKPREKTIGISLIYHLALSQEPTTDGFHQISISGPYGLAAETGIERHTAQQALASLETLGLIQSHTVTEKHPQGLRTIRFFRLNQPSVIESLRFLNSYCGRKTTT